MENKHDHGKLILIIALFSVAFFALQVMDLALTKEALKDSRLSELNPLYAMAWFIPLKLSMIILIAPLTYTYGRQHPRLAYSAMGVMIAMYIIIVSNNAYQMHLAGII